LFAVAAVLLVGAVASVVAGSATIAKRKLSSGGVLRVGWEQGFAFSDNLDPTGEYGAFGIFDNLLIRTLVGYTYEAGPAGNVLVPDIATSVPTPTNGGTTYTFHLKSGIKFGPPVDREVTSRDFAYAMERLANRQDGGEYPYYYTVIKGWTAYAAGKAKSIFGIETPNVSTIVFNLIRPTGDFLYRMAMPATGPIPVEVAKCFAGRPGKYGRDLVSTAGYMIAGMDKVSDSSCANLEPASGFDGQTTLDLVRNPSYDQSTDPTRKNYVAEVIFTVDSNGADVYNKIEAGQLDLATSSIPPSVLRAYATTPSLRAHFFTNAGDQTWYIGMNLTQPPFDDLHVRKALNWVIDKTALVQAFGGPTMGAVANHIVPDSMFDNALAGYAPYRTPGNQGSLSKARAAMTGSKYDPNHRGMCDAPQCKNVLLVIDTLGYDEKMLPVIEQDAKEIGITFRVRMITEVGFMLATPRRDVPIGVGAGWGKDYADALTFLQPLFNGRGIIPAGNTNSSLVGITRGQCTSLKVAGNCNHVPNVDVELDRCAASSGHLRLTCYENLDRYLMTNVVPWVPYLSSSVIRITSNNVTRYRFDQFSTTPAYSQIAVK
jgi:peptide/nickel transport system substrate-binding protein